MKIHIEVVLFGGKKGYLSVIW